ncbi:MAG: GNAT family N-acetyltransferase [bacterium]|nr:GNAT family N-acetyltransferase [bacterium]
MNNYHFELMKFPDDKAEINSWQDKYKETEGWKNIYQFILENGLIYNLGELIATNYEIMPIGDDEVKLAFSIKDEKEVIGFIICQEFEMTSDNPELFLQYIVLRPDMQNKGIGKNIFKILPDAVEKQTGVRPNKAFSYIETTNLASQKLYKNFGFEFRLINNNNNYILASGEFEKSLEQEK